MDYFDPFSVLFWQTIGSSVACGAIIGLERELRGKPAGVRTSILICMSTAVFVHLGATLQGAGGDPARVLGQVVTGVGFLGAGVILTREGMVLGVTTAAVIWVLAAAGCAIGLGHILGAIAISLVTVAVLTGVEFVETAIGRLARSGRDPDESESQRET